MNQGDTEPGADPSRRNPVEGGPDVLGGTPSSQGAGTPAGWVLLLAASSFLSLALWAQDKPEDRASRRIAAYAPPTIPHEIYDSPCLDCHSGMDEVPAIPHKTLPNCRQCHVPRTTDSVFRENTLAAAQEPRSARRAYAGAPPVMPHRRFMRENCLACHGPQARPDIKKTPHPERAHCVQCHVEQSWATDLFRKNGNIPDSRATP